MAEPRDHNESAPEPDIPPALRDALAGMYDGPAPLSAERRDAIVVAALRGSRSRRRTRLKVMTYRLVPLAAAAVFILAVVLSVKWGEQQTLAAGRAIARQETVAGWGADLSGVLATKAVRMERLAEIEAARQRLHDLKIAAEQGLADLATNRAIQDVLKAFKDVHRPLHNVGEWDAALEVVNEALGYVRGDNPTGKPINDWIAIFLDDLAGIYVAMGEFDMARQAYEESIAVRQQLVEQDVATNRPEWASHIRAEHRALRLTPLYWRLSHLAILEGDLAAAHSWHAVAEQCLYSYFAGVCAAAAALDGVEPPDVSTLLDAYRAAPAAFREPPTYVPEEEQTRAMAAYSGHQPSASIVVKLREHLYREARLRRVEGDYAAARPALRDGEQLAYYPVADESRLDFSEPMEAARIAILLGEFQTALAQIDIAEGHAGPLTLNDDQGRDVHKPPIGPLRLAELSVLKAAALLGSGGDKVEAQRLIGEAIALRDAFADRLTGEARENFLRQFRTWDQLAEASR